MERMTRTTGIARDFMIGMILAVYTTRGVAGTWQETSEYSNVGSAVPALGSLEGDGKLRLYLEGKRWTWSGSGWSAETLRKQGLFVSGYPYSWGQSLSVVGPRGPAVYETGMDTHLYEIRNVDGQTQVTDMGGVPGTQAMDAIAVGAGRGDSIPRVYVAESGSLYEFSWNGAAWENRIVTTGTGADYPVKVAVGTVRDDGIHRLYIGTLGHGVWEYGWEGSTWIARLVGVTQNTEALSAITVGDARGDGRPRLYAQSPSVHVVHEWAWVGDRWEEARIPYPFQGISAGWYGVNLVIGDGRGDGRPRLYAAEAGEVWELTRSGSGWEALFVGRIRGEETRYQRGYMANFLAGLAVGPGRNDGLPRVYGTTWNGILYEWTYLGGLQPGLQGSLFQQPPYPNPFRPAQARQVWVQVVVYAAGPATIQVYSGSGELVKAILDEFLMPGWHWIGWDGKNEAGEPVTSGMYLIRAAVAGDQGTRKIMLIR